MQVILYSNNCPKCKILKMKLDQKNIKYETVSDVDLMIEKGFSSMPMLEVDDKIMSYTEAIKWVLSK